MLVHHNSQLIDSHGTSLGRVHGWAPDWCAVHEFMEGSPWRFPQGFAITFRRELLMFSDLRRTSVDFFNGTEKFAHDQWIYLLAWCMGRLASVGEILADYRQHATNSYGLTHSSRGGWHRLASQFDKLVDFSRYSVVCDRMASILREAGAMASERHLQERANLAADRFGELAVFYERRGVAYASSSPLRRLLAWSSLASAGGYGRQAFWSFGRREALRDFLLGVCLGRLRNQSGSRSLPGLVAPNQSVDSASGVLPVVTRMFADVSTIIPTHNRPDMLRQAIAAELGQTLPPREVIVVDNGAKSETEDVIRDFGNQVVLIRSPGSSRDASRNLGVDRATSSWISLLDDDDYHLPEFLAATGEIMRDGRADLIVTDQQPFDENGCRSGTGFANMPSGYWDGVKPPGTPEPWSFVDKFPLERLPRPEPL